MSSEKIKALMKELQDKANGCDAQITQLNAKIEYFKGKAQGYWEARNELEQMLEESEAVDE